MTVAKPCLTCGTPTTRGTYCEDHAPQPRVYGTKPEHQQPRRIGYDAAWDKLSKRARALQPWCSDCHTTEDLTTDHSERAWRRKAAGKPIRLRDVDVVCRSCNAIRGRQRPYASGDMTQGDAPSRGRLGPPRSGQSLDHTPLDEPPYAPGGMS